MFESLPRSKELSMKRNVKKLELNRETIRSLTSLEMTDVAGGKGGYQFPKTFTNNRACGVTVKSIALCKPHVPTKAA
jgi:hypothetical protein